MGRRWSSFSFLRALSPKCALGLGIVKRAGAMGFQVDGFFTQVDGGLPSGPKEPAESEDPVAKRENSFSSLVETHMGGR